MDIPIFETDNSISAKAFRDGYELGKSNVKSSLKIDIEKRIDELGIPDYTNEAAYAKLELLNEFLELIETVEP